MSVYFHIGRTPELSLAELRAFFPISTFRLVEPAIVVTDELNPQSLDEVMRWGAGCVDAGEIVQERVLTEDLVQTIAQVILPNSRSVAVSFFDREERSVRDFLGLVKKELQRQKRTIRYVLPSDGMQMMRSASLTHEMNQGRFEHFALWREGDAWTVARTTAIQPIEEWSQIDVGKPARRIGAGMLPAKVARMMLNIALGARVSGDRAPVVYDPFCGTGTVLLESLRLGCVAWGSDILPEAVESAERNLAWFQHFNSVLPVEHPYFHYRCSQGDQVNAKIFQADAVHLDELLPQKSVDIVVSEPYMGKLMTVVPELQEAKNKAKGLLKLYLGFFKALYPVLVEGGVVVFTVPFYRLAHQELRLGLIDRLRDIGYNPLISAIDYFHEDTIVGREIIVFRKEKISNGSR